MSCFVNIYEQHMGEKYTSTLRRAVLEECGYEKHDGRPIDTRLVPFNYNTLCSMPRRRPLADIPVNRAPYTELSNDTKQRLLGRALAGQSGDEIATAELLPKTTINTSISKAIIRGTIANKPRSGQPKKYTDRDERRILRYARLQQKWKYSDLRSIQA